MNFTQCKAAISGGGSGLGEAVAKHILAAGGQVAILDLKPGNLQHEYRHFFHTDVCDEIQVDDAIASAVEKIGPITLAVNCAGIAPSQRVLGRDELMSSATFAKVIQINLIGTFTLCRAAANVMQYNHPQGDDNERGVIINTASIAAMEGQIGQAAYAASKGGVASMTLPLAREFARIGIRVNTIAPGLFETPMFDTLPQEAREALAANTPYPPRLGNPREFAMLVQQIYENSMLNGATIRLDGALRMQPK